jgi:hypothetical protein
MMPRPALRTAAWRSRSRNSRRSLVSIQFPFRRLTP